MNNPLTEQAEEDARKAEIIAIISLALGAISIVTSLNQPKSISGIQGLPGPAGPGGVSIKSGTIALTAGAALISNGNARPDSIILPVYVTVAGAVGALEISDHGDGTFTIVSSNGADVNLVKWYVITPL